MSRPGPPKLSDKEATRQAVLRGLLGPHPPTHIGRFELIEEVGSGGMGRVTLARDSTLDRRVALKRVRGRFQHDPEHETRLRREARALAALNHPNVVAVYDVIRGDGVVHIAMEYIDGVPLDRWVRTAQPDASAVLRAYVQAGRGLAAAHAAQITHRDFKPSNAIIDTAGVVRVLDFGLAVSGPSSAGERSAASASAPRCDDAIRLTQTGATMGTPAYMAPEQVGGDASPAADQYSYCASLWEALAGERPLRGAHRARPSEPRAAGTPAAVWPLLERGLSRVVSERWPSMDALVEQLEGLVAGPSRPKWATWLTGAAAVGGLMVWLGGDAGARREACREALGRPEQIWSGRDRIEIRDDVFAREGVRASTIWASTEQSMERFERRWAEAALQACQDGSASHAVACLDDLRVRADVYATQARDPNRVAARAALSALGRMDDPGQCLGDATRARTRPPLDRVLSRSIARAEALSASTQYDLARARFEALLPDARQSGGEALLRVLHGLANCQHQFGEHASAERNLEEAYWLGTGGVLAGRIPVIVSQLAFAVAATDTRRTPEALEWLRHGEASVVRLGLPAESREPLLTTKGILLRNVGRMAEAKATLTEAVSLLESPGSDPAEKGDALVHLGNTLSAMGEIDDARIQYLRARDSFAATGDLRPSRGSAALDGLGIVALQRGNMGDAERWLREAADAQAEAGVPVAAATWSNLALAVAGQGRFDEARRYHGLALADADERFDDSHPTLATLRINVAYADIAVGELDRAEERARRALVGFEESLGPDHEFTATARMALAELQMRRGLVEGAAKDYDAALSVVRERLSCTHPTLSAALIGAAEAQRRLGEPSRCASLLEEGLACAEQLDPTAASTWMLQAHVGWAQLEIDRGRLEQARHHIEQAERASADVPVEAAVRGRLASARAAWALATGDHDAARRSTSAAQQLLADAGDTWAQQELGRTTTRSP